MVRNTTGPPRAAPGELCCICATLQTTLTDDDRHQRLLIVWPPALCIGSPVINCAKHSNHFSLNVLLQMESKECLFIYLYHFFSHTKYITGSVHWR